MVEKLMVTPEPEKIKEIRIIDTLTLLIHAGCRSTCKIQVIRLSFFTSLIIMVAGMHLFNF